MIEKITNEISRSRTVAVPKIKKTVSKDAHEFEVEFKGGKEKITVPSTKEFFRLAGYYLAEGSVSNNSYLNFSFGSHEKNYIEDVKKLLKNVFGITKVYEPVHKTNNGTSVVVGSAKIARVFKQLGTSAKTKSLLQWMLLEDKGKQKE